MAESRGRRVNRSVWGAAAFALIVLVGAYARESIWRAAYPYLPAKIQAAPYVVRGRLSDNPTPVPLPTSEIVRGASNFAVSTVPVEPTLPPPGSDRATPSAVAVVTAADLPTAQVPSSVALAAPVQQYQTWNNCGPATMGMALGLVGESVPQADAARRLKPDPDDKNVSPDELAAFAVSRGFGAQVRTGGTETELKQLLALGVPIVAEIWFIPEPGDEMGHYVLIHGYDDASGAFFAADSYKGPDRRLDYREFDSVWRVFNRLYVAVYPLSIEREVGAVWAAAPDAEAMHRRSAAAALEEVIAAPDAFAWFNLGSSLAAVGDPAAVDAFDEARAAGLPWRMLWYQFGPFEAYAAAGRWPDVVALSEANLVNAPNLEESWYWLGRAREATGDAVGARAAYEAAVAANPLYYPATEALSR